MLKRVPASEAHSAEQENTTASYALNIKMQQMKGPKFSLRLNANADRHTSVR